MKRKAFTLLELLVVIAIIALLAMLLAPSFRNVAAMGRATICRTNLHELSKAFALSYKARMRKRDLMTIGSGRRYVYPKPMSWPSIPSDTVTELEIYKCPEDEIVPSVAGSLENLEYECEHGVFSLEGPGTYETMYKKRRGTCPDGPYTEFIFQDDYSNQYYNMDFNGWVDTDGGIRVYDSGVVHVWNNIQQESVGSVPNWSGAHGGYPTGINTCGNQNDILYQGEGAFGGDPKLQTHRGSDYRLPNWGIKLTNYGISSNAYKYPSGSERIVLVDYKHTVVDVDAPLNAEGLLLDSARHLGKVNYLRAGGSVRTATPQAISPRLQPVMWEP